MSGQSRAQKAICATAVVAVALAPLSALKADAAVQTGDAQAGGPGIALENTGGNVEFGTGHSESRVVLGDPAAAPATPAPLARVGGAPAAKTVDPHAAKLAKARALVDAAKARAQAQIDEARRHAEEAVERAHQQAEDAKARSAAQSDAARARSAQSDDDASSASASASSDD
jgi:hypothetical protein